MRRTPFLFVIFLTSLALFKSAALRAGEDYKFGPDSEVQEGIAKGAVTEYKFTESKIYPGTSRSYWIYLPPNFNTETEYPIMVFFDGGGCIAPKGGFRVPVVFDNLIAKKEIPPLVGLFINPGDVPPVTKGTRGRSTRSYEYDTPDEVCPRFVIDEMIPLVKKHARLSAKPDDHAVWGISSGGIAAFNAAWQRPDYFSKVISYIGSFTNIRGAYWFPSAIRKTERKPIRVFLQEGSTDLDNVHGNWPMGNQEMAAALRFAGYDYKFTMGDGGHSGKQGGAILPDALRWMWRKPEPLPAPTPEVPNDMALSGVLIPGEEWQLVVEGKKRVAAACSDAEGNFYFSDPDGEGVFKVALDGKVALFNSQALGVDAMKFGPDGKLYASRCRYGQLAAYEKDGKEEILDKVTNATDLVVDHKGRVYFIQPSLRAGVSAVNPLVSVWEGPGRLRVLSSSNPPSGGPFSPGGIALSPNQETLAVSDTRGSGVFASRIEPDGSLIGLMPVMPYSEYGKNKNIAGSGMVCDTRRRFYCATSDGIEVYDPDGRPIGLVLPPPNSHVTGIALSGPELNWLFALSEGKVFKRKVKAKGFVTNAPPILSDEKKK